MMSKRTALFIQTNDSNGNKLSLPFYSNGVTKDCNVKLSLKLNCFMMSPSTASREEYSRAPSYNPEAGGKNWSFGLP